MSTAPDAEVVVIGAGIVGLATARALVARGVGPVVVLDKEADVATHQTGRNSGVVHSGIYYAPGSAKARLVAAARQPLERLCADHDIPVEQCGKIIVATTADELHRLDDLERRSHEHGIATERVGPGGVRDREPHACGLGALIVHSTAITDFGAVTRALRSEVIADGHEVRTSHTVIGITESASRVRVVTDRGDIEARWMVNCAGLHSDRIAALCGLRTDLQIVAFRGEYVTLRSDAASWVNHLIYPVPDPRYPFLGVHLTRTVDGTVHAGPNAVLATAREGYRRRDIDPAELWRLATFPGTRRLAGDHWRTGLLEVRRSLSRRRFAESLARLVPGIEAHHLIPAQAGVRAQAVRHDGSLLDDFCFLDGRRSVHVLNAPSPAATAGLAIGAEIADRLGVDGKR